MVLTRADQKPCFPLEDTSGDGELDLSGIDDLEIDRVSAGCDTGISPAVIVC